MLLASKSHSRFAANRSLTSHLDISYSHLKGGDTAYTLVSIRRIQARVVFLIPIGGGTSTCHRCAHSEPPPAACGPGIPHSRAGFRLSVVGGGPGNTPCADPRPGRDAVVSSRGRAVTAHAGAETAKTISCSNQRTRSVESRRDIVTGHVPPLRQATCDLPASVLSDRKR